MIFKHKNSDTQPQAAVFVVQFVTSLTQSFCDLSGLPNSHINLGTELLKPQFDILIIRLL